MALADLRKSSQPSAGLDIVIIGGGATGVKLAAGLREASHVHANYGIRRLDPDTDVRLTLLEGASRILEPLQERVSKAATELLVRRHVRAVTGCRVARIEAGRVDDSSGNHYPADLCVWATGIKAPDSLATLGLPTAKGGQLAVDSHLRAEGRADIFALGDCAACVGPDGKRVPPCAQSVHHQAVLGTLRTGVPALARFLVKRATPLVKMHWRAAMNVQNASRTAIVNSPMRAVHTRACVGWRRATMHHGLEKSVAATGLALCALLALPASAMDVLGKKPSHAGGGPSSVVNDQAITRMIWAPGIDDGYVPQGVTWADRVVYLSGYRSTDPTIDRGPCRIFKVDPESGNALGQFDLPEDCGHVGGLAHVGKGILIASDTRRLYRIDVATAFAPGKPSNAVTATVALRGEVKGSFVDFDGSAIFVGSFERDAAKAKGHFFPLSIFDTHKGKAVDEGRAIRSIALPQEAQGAAFDRAGNLWITASSSRFGRLYRLDSKTGQIASSYEMVIGMEDIAFDDDGRLWSVSEAGALRWQRWNKTFPVLFRVDPGKLKAR